MDWADKLVSKMRKRGETHKTAEEFRNEVTSLCEENLKRWGETSDKDRRKEMKRLIKLRQEGDERSQLRFNWRQKGIEINPDHNQLGKISSVKLPFTNEEWADLLNKEGQYLGACCADISRIRDILQGACREDHFIEVEDLHEAVYLAKHHGFTISDEPIGRMIALWGKIKDDARVRSEGTSVKKDDPKDALELLYKSSGAICWDDLYSKEGQSKDVAFDRHMNRNYALATIQTAVRTLFFKLKELDPGPIEGYGIIREDDEVANTSRGLAVFRTGSTAKEVCDRWNKPKDRKHTYIVKKVRISMERGYEVLPDDHFIQETPDVAKCSEKPKPISF
jgi:hypothetical protein